MALSVNATKAIFAKIRRFSWYSIKYIKSVQVLLNACGYKLVVDGVAGYYTINAIYSFQTKYKLTKDGIPGQETLKKLKAVVAAKSPVKTIITVALKELGYTAVNGVSKFGQWYGYPKAQWCAAFVSWCAYVFGILNKIIPKFIGCQAGLTWFKNRGKYKKRGTYTPKAGDVVFFDWKPQNSIANHVGFVEKMVGDQVYTISGNSGYPRAVRRNIYNKNDYRIMGYGVI